MVEHLSQGVNLAQEDGELLVLGEVLVLRGRLTVAWERIVCAFRSANARMRSRALVASLRIAEACACPSWSAFSASRSRTAIIVSNTFCVVDSGRMILWMPTLSTVMP